MKLQSVCVFCGANSGAPAHRAAAHALGECIAARGLTLVCGGGKHGLMGALADAALAHGGRVVGVIPAKLRGEVAHPGLSQLITLPGLCERKQRMLALADAFIALPGGVGTLDEIMEVLTWNQLGLFPRVETKPLALLNAAADDASALADYWGELDAMLAAAERAGFFRPRPFAKPLRAATPAAALDLLEQHIR